MDQPQQMMANDGKELTIKIGNKKFARIPIKTHLIKREDNIVDVATKYLKGKVKSGDIVFITEKIVGITQGRAIPLKDIKPRPLAIFLSKYVTKTPYGIGLGMPETMEMALRECGTPRILFAAFVSAVGKVFGRKGDFYRVAGDKARAIDGPTQGTMPPFDTYVVLGPENPVEVAKNIKKLLDRDVIVTIVDINDLGGNILGSSDPVDEALLLKILKDNPLGQDDQGTPIGIVRKED